MSLQAAQNSFCLIVNSLSEEDRSKFLSWCKEQFSIGATHEYKEAYFDLRTIAEDIKALIPLEAILPSEKVMHENICNVRILLKSTLKCFLEIHMQIAITALPCLNNQPIKKYKPEDINKPVIHVDSFLFEDDQIDDLVEEGKLSRNYCRNCGSLNVTPITFVSHSASVQRSEFIFRYILPDLKDKVVLDVGSRLGALLYGAYYYSSASKIIGVEINEDLCKLQNHIIGKYSLGNRIEVIHNDICNIPEVVQAANVILLNNPFECFLQKNEQIKIWTWLRNAMKSGTMLVTVPSLEETFSNLQVNLDVSWMRKMHIDPDSIKMDDIDLLSEICLYVVI
ncbi:uncharacterized protein LOC118187870 isoform X1 [Stegodyphus dumicola]|uniref:uncharacterized protein LOC118187870 isoform X1 n=1 Tax=Stegodyphus dumicola TaxID=202533 RepID=UPI0015AFD6C4|nr:uncharacterized protein LOC118187870 isoform X1 [Stegodyphus dumicola]